MPDLFNKTESDVASDPIPLLTQDSNTKSHAYFIREYNDSISKFNAFISSLANGQLDRDYLTLSLTNKIVLAKKFLCEYLESINISPSTFQSSFDTIDWHLLRLKPTPLTVDPLFVFDKVRDQFDLIRASIKKAIDSIDSTSKCDTHIVVQYLTHLKTTMSRGIEYYQANPYFPQQVLDDWLPRIGL